MFWLKCCPHCDGDLYQGADRYGAYLACLQCARDLTEAEEVVIRYIIGLSTLRPEGEESTITTRFREPA